MAAKKAPAKKVPARKRIGSMSDAHKAALEAGRSEIRVVRQYLDALEANQPRRGRKRTSESITKRLSAIERQISDAKSINRLHLIQERQDLEAELSRLGGGADMASLEEAFVEVATSYSRRKGITYSTWRDDGVPAAVLKSAGIDR